MLSLHCPSRTDFQNQGVPAFRKQTAIMLKFQVVHSSFLMKSGCRKYSFASLERSWQNSELPPVKALCYAFSGNKSDPSPGSCMQATFPSSTVFVLLINGWYDVVA